MTRNLPHPRALWLALPLLLALVVLLSTRAQAASGPDPEPRIASPNLISAARLSPGSSQATPPPHSVFLPLGLNGGTPTGPTKTPVPTVKPTTTPVPTDTPPGAPAAPSNLRGAPPAASLTSIELTWQDNADDETGFELERKDGATFTLIAVLDQDATSFLDTSLEPAKAYQYRLRSVANGLTSAWVTASANTPAQPQTMPAKPASCWVENVTSTSLDLIWTDSSNNEESFGIYLEEGGVTYRLGYVSENSTYVTVIDLTPDTDYLFGVTAYNAAGESNYCITDWVHTPAVGSQSLVRFVNNASYPIVQLEIDGVELFSEYPMGLLPGNYYEIPLTPGQHDYYLSTGHWSDRQNKFLQYSYWDPFMVTSGNTTEIVIEDIPIENLLTQFQASGYWEGTYWDANSLCRTAAFKFYQNGSYDFFVAGSKTGSGTFSLVSRLPSIFGSKFSVGEGPEYEGLLIEPYGYFTMKNGPATWNQITYSYKPGGYVRNPFCP